MIPPCRYKVILWRLQDFGSVDISLDLHDGDRLFFLLYGDTDFHMLTLFSLR